MFVGRVYVYIHGFMCTCMYHVCVCHVCIFISVYYMTTKCIIRLQKKNVLIFFILLIGTRKTGLEPN